ncbi:MAG: RlmE family RNA methyltransferase [Bacteroidetes bacterium]|nr:RlmE family RNA methyltransferase [Bacteroidota bacterium]
MAYQPNDHYARKARQQDYKARSVFKLEEIDQKHRLLAPGMQVLDLGCSPGSWSQYASQKIGAKGRLLGIDLTAVSLPLPNATFVQADINEADIPALFAQAGIVPPLDLVISDMAPKTTGVRVTDQARSAQLCEMALLVATRHLRRGGSFVCKFFDGPDFTAFRAHLTRLFDKVTILRPQATRSSSKEIFFTASGYTGRSYEETLV